MDTTRLTSEQIIAREMEKLKAMGITMSVRLAPRVSDTTRVLSVLRDAAKEHGIHYGDSDDEQPPRDETDA